MTVLVNGGLCNSASGTLDGTLGYGTNPFDITCADVMKGNSVTITMNGPFLALCEVQILGKFDTIDLHSIWLRMVLLTRSQEYNI